MSKSNTKTKNFPTNSTARSVESRKKDQCQWCHAAVPFADQFTVVNDLEANDGAGKVVKRKVGKRELPEKQSHWCEGCAKKRVTMSQRWLDRRAGVKPEPKKKAAPAKKAVVKKKAAPAKKAAAAPAKPKKAAAKKRVVKKAAPAPAPEAAEKVADDLPF